jgi:hypothetical protein
LAFGLVPRLTNSVVYGVLAWSLLVELLGGIVSTSQWFFDISLVHHMQPAPDCTSGAALIALGIFAAAIATAALWRRDMAGMAHGQVRIAFSPAQGNKVIASQDLSPYTLPGKQLTMA